MLRSLWLLFVYVSFLGIGLQAPFILALGYVWVDTFRPQDVSYIILNQVPVALIMGVAAFGMYFATDRRSPPRLSPITVMQLLLAGWVTVTLVWAVAPELAWAKWDWAFKTLVFSAFLPLVIRSQIQIEAFMQVYVFALAANLLPYGAKIAISGGGYGRELGLAGGNTGLGEGATLAAVAVMTVPLLLYLRKHGRLMPKSPIFRLLYLGLAAASVFTTVGTFQRTGLIGLLVLGVATLIKTRHKILTGIVGAAVAGAIFYFTSDAWTQRISTIGTYQADGSAMTRILVWKWTLDYVMTHPLGGGFSMFVINHIEHGPDEMHPGGYTEFGRAFHSIYFEVLGEHGWIGLALFVGMLLGAQILLQRASRKVRDLPEHLWCRDLASALQVSLAVMSVCGCFIGIAFQPMIHYLLAMSVSVAAYVQRVTQAQAAPPRWGRATAASQVWAQPLPNSAVPAREAIPQPVGRAGSRIAAPRIGPGPR